MERVKGVNGEGEGKIWGEEGGVRGECKEGKGRWKGWWERVRVRGRWSERRGEGGDWGVREVEGGWDVREWGDEEEGGEE